MRGFFASIRLLRLVLHLFRGLATCGLIFPVVSLARRSGMIQVWSRTLLRICRVELVIMHNGAVLPSHALVVANHVSWLDIFVMNAAKANQFVAKAEIRDWPLVGWLCQQSGTVFIARGRLRDVRRIYTGLVERLLEGGRVAFFPEGGTSEQGVVQPFHSNLFEAAIEAQVSVQPYAVRYLTANNAHHPAVNYVDPITFVQSVWMILNAEVIRAELIELAPIAVQSDTHRRELAQAARSAIATALNADAP